MHLPGYLEDQGSVRCGVRAEWVPTASGDGASPQADGGRP
jgi:hypothetical protein